MIKLLFYPAIVLMNRLGYTRKFMLLGALFLVAIGVLTYSLFASLDTVIRASQRQLEFISLIKPISRTIQAVQQHRGFSIAVLGGNEAMRDRRAAKEQEVVAVFNALEKELPASLRGTQNWQEIRKDWEFLRKEWLVWTAPESFAAHTRLIEHLRIFEVAHTQGVETEMFYLTDIATNRLPGVLEHLGRIRAYGAGILTEKRITGAQKREIHGMIASLNDVLTPLQINLEKATRHNPALRNALSAISGNVLGSVQRIVGLVESDILAGRFITSPEDFMTGVTAEIDNGYSHLYESLLPGIETLIKARIVRAEKVLRTSIGIAILLFLGVVYFSIGSYYATTGSIRALARSARAFAAGNLHERVDLDTHDEIGQVGDSFNEMADGFSALLTECKQTEEELQIRAQILDSTSDTILVLDFDGNFIYLNEAAWKTRGYTRDEMMAMNLRALNAPEYVESIGMRMRDLMENGLSAFESAHRRKDGSIMPVEISARIIEAGGRKLIISVIRDITERRQSEEKIRNLAYYDALTGLPNRTLFYDRLAQEIKKAHRAGLKMALLFIDLDKFKEVNDTLGHSMGDLLLTEAACRISACVRETDTVARLGGDEFTVILSELGDAGSVERVAESILQKMAEPFRLGDELAYVSASMGITLYPDDAAEVEDLLKDADQAMYAAKNAGRNRLSYFTPALEQAAQIRLHLLNDLRGALAGNQFEIHYQPIVEMTSGRIRKAEALIRWQHPQRGMVSPAQFIPLAEETGLIVEIGDWMFREAAHQAKQWRDRYDAEFQISVNKSPAQFRQSDVAREAWLDYLQKLGLPGQSITIEITEGLLLDAEAGITDRLLEFRDAGMQVSIDDFGTGYSSLSYLKKFDIDYLKIDQSFVRNLANDSNDTTLSEAIIVMAHKLGLKVIAEGVETEEQRGLLAIAGCDYAQGYLFSRPLPVAEFEKFLESHSAGENHYHI